MQKVAKIFYKGETFMEIKRDFYLHKLINRKNNGLISVSLNRHTAWKT